jgi:hypothetical protein
VFSSPVSTGKGQLEFHWQQVNLLAARAHRSRDQVKFEIAGAQHRLFDDSVAAPRERPTRASNSAKANGLTR